MGKGDKETAEALKAEVAKIKTDLPALEEEDRALCEELDGLLAITPNLPAADVPQGEDEADNVEVSRWGEPRAFDFDPREHADIGPALGLEFDTGAEMSGARFTFLRGQMARMERALGQFMLDRQSAGRGYTECVTPILVRPETMFGTGQLPKFAEDSFETTDGRWLIPSHRPHPLLPLGSGRGGEGHPRLHPPAPVFQGRAGLDLQARGLRGRARPHGPLRRTDTRGA